MSVLTESQQANIVDIINEQRIYIDQEIQYSGEKLDALAERLHFMFNSDMQAPQTETKLMDAWFFISNEFSIPFKIVSGSNIGGLPNGSIIMPNGHLMEVYSENNMQYVRAVCEHDYSA